MKIIFTKITDLKSIILTKRILPVFFACNIFFFSACNRAAKKIMLVHNIETIPESGLFANGPDTFIYLKSKSFIAAKGIRDEMPSTVTGPYEASIDVTAKPLAKIFTGWGLIDDLRSPDVLLVDSNNSVSMIAMEHFAHILVHGDLSQFKNAGDRTEKVGGGYRKFFRLEKRDSATIETSYLMLRFSKAINTKRFFGFSGLDSSDHIVGYESREVSIDRSSGDSTITLHSMSYTETPVTKSEAQQLEKLEKIWNKYKLKQNMETDD